MKPVLIALLTCVTGFVQAENLFVNGNLEDPKALFRSHTHSSQFIKGWHASAEPNPTYFYDHDVLAIAPKEGQGFFGLKVYESASAENRKYRHRQYIQGAFKEPLVAGETYYLSFSLALHHSCRWSMDNLGIIFVQERESVLKSDVGSWEPDIRLNNGEHVNHTNWRTYTVQYTARGGERSMVFGAFGENNAKAELRHKKTKDGMHKSAFYYLDDFRLLKERPGEGCFIEQMVTRQKPRRLSLVLDYSGSMRQEMLMDAVQKGVLQSTARFKPHDQITIVGFATNTRLLYDGPKFKLTRDTLNKLIHKCSLAGSTNVYGGLKRAFRETRGDEEWESDQMILVSDGDFSMNSALKKMLSEPSHAELFFMHLGKKANNRRALEHYGVQYIQTSADHLSQDFVTSIQHAIYANQCDMSNEKTMDGHYAFVFDNSGSMDGNERDIVRLLNAMFDEMHDDIGVELIRSNDDWSKSLYYGQKRGIVSSVEDKVWGGSFNDGDSWEPGIRKAWKERENRKRIPHCTVLITDYDPRDYALDDAREFSKKLKDDSSRLIAIYINEDDHVFELLKFHPQRHRFVSGVSQSELPKFMKFMYGSDSSFVTYKVPRRSKRKRSIKAYRKQHQLFNS